MRPAANRVKGPEFDEEPPPFVTKDLRINPQSIFFSKLHKHFTTKKKK
jgi:hypothetical protein